MLWPKRATFEELLGILNVPELSGVWREDETIGWVYQYFNGGDERRAMRDASQAPRNSRELAVRKVRLSDSYDTAQMKRALAAERQREHEAKADAYNRKAGES